MSFSRSELAAGVACLALIATVGCDSNKSSPTTRATPQPTAPAKRNEVAQPPVVGSDPSSPSAPKENPPKTSPTAPADAQAPPAPVEEVPERIAILTPGGPLLIEVALSIDGRPHGEGIAKLVAAALKSADRDSDGRSTWKELAEVEVAADAPAGGAANQEKMWTEQFDWNRDGQVQPREAAAWLGRDAGASARAFALRSSRGYSPHPRATSRIWKLLDADENGALAHEEIAAAPARLARLDANDDHVIESRELASLRDELAGDGNSMSTTSDSSRYAALHLEPTLELDRLEYLLLDVYAPRQDLVPESFPGFPRLAAQLDADKDQWIDQRELAALLHVEPHLKLAIAFNRRDEQQQDQQQPASAAIDVLAVAPEVTVSDRAPDRVTLLAGGARVIVSAHDLTPTDADAASRGAQTRLMVHDQCDALFELADMSADGRLGERELARLAERLAATDANGDGNLAGDELPYALVVTFLRGERPEEASFYIPPRQIAHAPAAASPSWFQQADYNNDGDVSRREFLGDLQQFAALDANGDDFIDASEAAALKGL